MSADATAGPAVPQQSADRPAAVRPRESLGSRLAALAGGGLVRVVLLVVGLFWLLPTVGLLLSSLRTPVDISSSGWWKVFTSPSQLTVTNYRTLLDNHAITDSLVNTALITIPATLLVVVIGALAGYAFAWMDFPGRDWWFIAVVAMLVVPVQVALIPVAKLFGDIGIFGDISGVVLFHTAFGLPFAIFLLRNFFAEIPRELLEAARLDGAGELRLFTRVVMPLGGPAIASLGIFQFLWVWNDMLVALIFADSNSQPVTVALQQQVRQFGNNIDILAPGAFVSMVIPLAVFFAFQRQFVSGVMAGAVK
ncbi:carbohydrate ABC transporter permease [Actinacidiphila bryophytorum]|uniref:Osmoprotective compounds uptake permease protein GgtD n=1 Tax=Actinacidiphila bryophytorum TaxID=1436133 RepID=A0A9W4ED55_9ACTN|nr:carbohydrate ABC transporter permease [Actinacidiphila bryophytorum]MBM9440433.1 carbohydrate ABC transporter permease [Actinacidiphila bryophytorum]MBN6546780.1 carbohydrate ABC transporter permease [Actinacidiphila bryophytorum]CAG7622936.1 Osmoprotective compounds uptake permease protein GgtD [Actinacidiphila bryophytorum]